MCNEAEAKTFEEAFNIVCSDQPAIVGVIPSKAKFFFTNIIFPTGAVDQSEFANQRLELSPAAQRQVLRWLGLSPSEALERLSPATWDKVTSDLVDADSCLPSKERSIPNGARLHFVDGKVVGVLPGDLVAVSNGEFVEQLSRAARHQGINLAESQIHSFQRQEGGFRLAGTFADLQSEPRKGDIVRFGLRMAHSAAGSFPSELEFFAFRIVCSNGMAAPICLEDNNGQKLRIRRSSSLGCEHVLSQVERIANHAFASMRQRITALTDLTRQPINLRREIDQFALLHRLSRRVRAELLTAYERGEHGNEETRFGLVNILSWLGTHGPKTAGHHIPASVLQRLQRISGVYSAQSVHRCPTCSRILNPSNN
jgi:hypothetical protein